MSIAVAQQKRHALFAFITGMLLMAAAVMAVSGGDSDGAGLRAGMVMFTAGAAFLLPWRYSLVATLTIWAVPNYLRSLAGDAGFFSTTMLLELPGLIGLAAFAVAVRLAVGRIETENIVLGADGGIDPATGVFEERAMRPALEAELSRARRFNRTFALVLIGIDEKHHRFAFRDEEDWKVSYLATAQLLRRTRNNIDRVYRRGGEGFAMILPESGEKEVTGLVRRLRKLAHNAKPREGEPGGPLPVSFGATFFPTSASTVDDLTRRAEIALKVSTKNWTRLQLDGAEAPPMPAPETMRQNDGEQVTTPVAAGTEAVPISSLADLSAQPRLSDEEVTQLLGRFDETLGLLRGLQEAS